MTAVVDASVWVSRLVASDINHTASHKWLEAHVAGGGLMVVPVIVLAEVGGAISRRSGQPRLGRQAIESLLRLRALRLVAVNRALGEAAAHLAADLALRGADVTYVALAQQLSLPLVTWDSEQLARAAKIVVAYTPPAMP